MKKPINELNDFLSFIPAVSYEYVVYNDDSANSEFVFLSSNCEEILGKSSDYFMSDMNHFWEMVHPQDLTRLIEESDSARAGGEFFASEVRLLRNDGDEIWVRLSSRPTTKTSNNDLIWAGYILDITKRKTFEIQLAKALEENEQLKQREKENIYRATVQSTQHILGNLLNQLVLVKREIGKNPTFSDDVAQKFNSMTSQAKLLVEKLSNVQEIEEENIKNSVYPK